jgi:hypothetical protein
MKTLCAGSSLSPRLGSPTSSEGRGQSYQHDFFCSEGLYGDGVVFDDKKAGTPSDRLQRSDAANLLQCQNIALTLP